MMGGRYVPVYFGMPSDSRVARTSMQPNYVRAPQYDRYVTQQSQYQTPLYVTQNRRYSDEQYAPQHRPPRPQLYYPRAGPPAPPMNANRFEWRSYPLNTPSSSPRPSYPQYAPIEVHRAPVNTKSVITATPLDVAEDQKEDISREADDTHVYNSHE
jgi:hypothetical protein